LSEIETKKKISEEKKKIRISVVIPAYNAEKYIQRCLDSVLAQTHPADEIIVVDDGSTDHTAEKVKLYGPAVRYLYQKNAGASVARNTGIQAARHEWIAFLDADDEWLPRKLELQVRLLEENPEWVWCGANYILCSCQQNRRGPSIDPYKAAELLGGQNGFANYFQARMAGIPVCTIVLLIKRAVIKEAGLFLPGLFRGEDTDLWFRIAYHWPEIGYISKPLAIYHMDIPDSSTRKHQSFKDMSALVQKHIKLSQDYGQLDNYLPCAVGNIRSWIRSSLFDERIYEVKNVLRKFSIYLPKKYIFYVRLLIIFPRLTMLILQAISWCVRTFKLRKKITRRRVLEIPQNNR